MKSQKIYKTNFFVCKKGVLTLEYTIVLIILSIVLILVLVAFLGPKIGLFNYFSNYVSTAKKWLPGKESIDTKESISSEKFDQFFEKFKATLESAVGSDEKCLIKYEKIDDFEGFKIELFNEGNNLVLRTEDEKGRIPNQEIIENINFCKIKPEIFFDNYLKDGPCTRNNNCKDDFDDKVSIIFTADEIDEKFGLQDGGFMYKPKPDKVCFIPTHRTGVTWYKALWQVFTKFGCDTSKNTLDDDCIKNIKKNIRMCGA